MKFLTKILLIFSLASLSPFFVFAECGNDIIEGNEICDSGVRPCSFFDEEWTGESHCNAHCTRWDVSTCLNALGETPYVYDPSLGCVDTDNGDNLFVKGTCYDKLYEQGLEDRCDGEFVEDFSCVNNLCVGNGHASTPCLNGCSEGVCLPFVEEENVKITNEKEIVRLEEPLSECLGCRLNQKTCLPIGTRVKLQGKQQFCDTDNMLREQYQEDVSCSNNFECASNVCINNKCISPSLLEKVINWFKNLF